jgi:hypothetical protein
MLISNPSHLRLKQTRMASQAGLTIVTTNRWLQTLVERGDLVKMDRGYSFTHIEQSLNEWIVLHKQRRSELYHSEIFDLDFPQLGRMVSPSSGAYAGGATAAERLGLDLHADSAVLYCDSEARIKLLKSSRLRPAQDGRFEIRTKYWEFDNWIGQSEGVAPLPLVYADLVFSLQARARDIAPKVFEKICRAHIEHQ